jgi:hypothetical protein
MHARDSEDWEISRELALFDMLASAIVAASLPSSGVAESYTRGGVPSPHTCTWTHLDAHGAGRAH